MGMEESRQIFAAEIGELLEEIEDSLLRLESAPYDREAVNSLFRAVHTIKGSASVVGVDSVEGFAHSVEGVLDRVRMGEVAVTGDLVELLLECRDHISNLVKLAMEGKPLDRNTEASGKKLLRQLGSFVAVDEEEAAPEEEQEEEGPPGKPVESRNWHISLRFGPDVMRNGMDPISFLTYLLKLGEIVSLNTLLDSMPPARQMDPETCYLGFEIDFSSDTDKKSIEDVFEFVKEDCRVKILPPMSSIESYVKLIDGLKEDRLKLGELLLMSGALTRSELDEALGKQGLETAEDGRLFGEILVDEKMVHSPVVDAALRKQSRTTAVKPGESKTIRVDTEKLDQLINMVGELVISGANINQQAERIRDGELLQSVDAMSRMIEEIRDRAMRVRMVPLWGTFNSFNRVVRDICHEKGKQMELLIEGGETELDRTVIEKIRDPLMHLVRNAGDHGIEPPEERVSLGKPPTGTVRLIAYQDTADVVIEIADDGRGLDREGILQKATGMGWVREAQKLPDRKIFGFIFEPGFSTASEVTSISGRGVGMDVVKRNIEALRGSIEIQSEKGAGTTIRVRLPLTLAIIDGFLVGIGEHFYVVPMDAVVECLELTEKDRRDAHGRHHVNLRGEILPYLRLSEMFEENGSSRSEVENIVVVRYADQKTGLVVDSLHGGMQAVIKNLGRFYRDVRGVSGATILGDGTVALILDIKGLVETALEMEGLGEP
jgi:two-component system chemotaxis sensor kinase CheA